MADLEAQTRIDGTSQRSTPDNGAVQYNWRYRLEPKKQIRLGRDPKDSDWAVPEDRMISAWHAILEWDGEQLNVIRRPRTVEYPREPANEIYFQNQPARHFSLKPGESFVIGATRFTLRIDEESDQSSPVDATIVKRQVERSRTELESVQFADPASFLRALVPLPLQMMNARNDAGLFRQALKVIRESLPRADAAAIVHIPPDAPPEQPRVTVVEQYVRHTVPALAGEFVPSRKLVRRVIGEERKKSCLHVWSTSPSDLDKAVSMDQSVTLGAMYQQGLTPWAICTPFQDGSQYALYVSGRMPGGALGTTRDITPELTEYQKFIEILVGMVETTRRTLRLTNQTALLREAWPRGIRKYLDDPERLEALLRPQEKDVTVLFCDLRNYSGFAEEGGAKLHEAWKEIQTALDTMSGAITERDGIVAGFRGDAVLGFWGWPEPQSDQVEKAADAAFRIHERLSGWMVKRRCGLGLTHGRALAGRLGAHDLAVVDLYGPVVNLAFRLEEMTKAFGVGIVVSDEVANELRRVDPRGAKWRTRGLGRVRPRGMKTPLMAYELVPPSAASGGSWMSGPYYQNILARWNEAVSHFTSGQWSEAAIQLDEFYDDPATQCLLRYMARTEGKPPADWDGSFTPRPPETV
jgi:class 3 adenylate cyclase